jgi:hypothetical protein
MLNFNDEKRKQFEENVQIMCKSGKSLINGYVYQG